MDLNSARHATPCDISMRQWTPGGHPKSRELPAVHSAEFESDRAEALAGVTEQMQALLAQDTRNPATLERLDVCFSLMRHLAGFTPVGC